MMNRTHPWEDHSSCLHNPSCKVSRTGVFLDFLLNKDHLCNTQNDTAICATCGSLLKVPSEYYSSNLRITLLWGSAIISSLSLLFFPNSYTFNLIVLPLLLYVFYKCIGSLWLTTNGWRFVSAVRNEWFDRGFESGLEPDAQLVKDCKSQRMMRIAAVVNGCYPVIWCIHPLRFTGLLLIPGFALVVMVFILKNIKFLWLGLFILIYTVGALICMARFSGSALETTIEWFSVIVFLTTISMLERGK